MSWCGVGDPPPSLPAVLPDSPAGSWEKLCSIQEHAMLFCKAVPLHTESLLLGLDLPLPELDLSLPLPSWRPSYCSFQISLRCSATWEALPSICLPPTRDLAASPVTAVVMVS